jgi:hypothetical protein
MTQRKRLLASLRHGSSCTFLAFYHRRFMSAFFICHQLKAFRLQLFWKLKREMKFYCHENLNALEKLKEGRKSESRWRLRNLNVNSREATLNHAIIYALPTHSISLAIHHLQRKQFDQSPRTIKASVMLPHSARLISLEVIKITQTKLKIISSVVKCFNAKAKILRTIKNYHCFAVTTKEGGLRRKTSHKRKPCKEDWISLRN